MEKIFYSPIFFAKGEELIRRWLKISPKGFNEKYKSYFSLHLERVFKDKALDVPPIAVKFTFTVYKNGWKIFSHFEKLQTLGREPLPNSFGWDKLEKLSVIDAIVYYYRQL